MFKIGNKRIKMKSNEYILLRLNKHNATVLICSITFQGRGCRYNRIL